MNKIILFCFSITLLLASCTQDNSKDNSAVSILVNEAEVIIDKYDNNVQSALDSKKNDYIETVSKSALDSSTVKINDLENLTLLPKNEELRITAINYVKSLQKIIDVQKSYATLTDTTSISTAKSLDTLFLDAVQEAKKMREVYISKLNSNIKN